MAALSLAEAQAAARQRSPELRAAREAATAARARERQAGAFANPTFGYARERTARNGMENSQGIAQLEQSLEIGGQRGARREAARLRAEAAEARVHVAEQQLDFDVARAYAAAAAAARRATLADQAAAAFTEAERVDAARLAAGDVSGYASRRLRLEVARYAAQRAEALLTLRTTRMELAALMAVAPDSLGMPVIALDEGSAGMASLDSLRIAAMRSRPDLRALNLEMAAVVADARLAAAERMPTPTFTAGYKRERIDDGTAPAPGLYGFVAGVSLPLALFDRRSGSIAAARADSRERAAEADARRRQVRLDVDQSHAALQAVDAQLAVLRPQLGESSRLALRAVQTAYAEGEISLVEWLDAVRAYQDAESTFATLHADQLVRRAALERAVGLSIFSRPTR